MAFRSYVANRGAVPRRRFLKRRSLYRRPAMAKRRRTNRYNRRSRKIYRRSAAPGNGTMVLRRVWTPTPVMERKPPRATIRMWKALGVRHYFQTSNQGLTSGVGANNPLRIALLPGTRQQPWNFGNGVKSTGWATTSGVSNYGTDYVTTDYAVARRILHSHFKLKLVFKQTQEKMRIRVSVVRARHTTPNNIPLDGWNTNFDEPINNKQFKVFYTKMFYFTSQDQVEDVKQLNLYMPTNRVHATKLSVPATAETDWTQQDTYDKFTYVMIDSDDQTFSDGEYCQVFAYLQSSWYELE